MRESSVRIAASVGIAIACLAWYAPTFGYGYVYDDREVVVGNELVARGISPGSIAAALVSDHGETWQPATWVSLQIDASLFGVDPRGFHRTNVLLHAANAVLVFLLVLAIAERDRRGPLRGRAATVAAGFVAALFAFHPQAIEPVAWITSRKDVLSTLFFLVAVLAWFRFVESGRSGWWWLVVGACAAGLMAKNVLVVLPFVLLLLDVWPLARCTPDDLASAQGRRRILRLVREKAALFALGALAVAVTGAVQAAGGNISSTDVVPIPLRLANALSSYLAYLEKSFVPTGLSVSYPYSAARLRPERLLVGAAVLLGVTAWAWRRARAAPWLAVGWLWFVGTLVPVIGLVPVGSHSMADRYVYVPHIGLWIALAWGGGALAERWPRARGAVVAVGLALVAGCLLASRASLPAWRDEIALFSHAVGSTPDSYVARYNLGFALAEAGREEEAIEQYRAAIGLHPGYLEARTNLAALLAKRGRFDEAEAEYATVAAHAADPGLARFNLARLQLARGRAEAAEQTVREGLSLAPANAALLNLLGVLRLQGGRPAEAVAPLEQALRAAPDAEEVANNLGVALRESGRPDDAARVLEDGVRRRPGSAPLLLNLGLAYAAAGRHEEALRVYARASGVAPQSAALAAAQAASHAALGQPLSAEEAWKRAVARAPEDAESRLRLGLALLERGDRAGAEAQLARLEGLDPGRAQQLRQALGDRPE